MRPEAARRVPWPLQRPLQRLAAEAQAYRSGVLASATGAAQAFEYLLAEYRSNSVSFGEDVTRYRMFLDTIEKILPRVRVYALDTERGGRFNLKLFGEAGEFEIVGPEGDQQLTRANSSLRCRRQVQTLKNICRSLWLGARASLGCFS